MKEISIKDINKIIDALYESSGVDFSDYAFSSLKRRIHQFLSLRKIFDIDGFVEKIKDDRIYTDHLIEEITVSVTEMFRDPIFWCAIRDSVLPVLNQLPVINIWHAACSTGEEVLSMAILLEEMGILNKCKLLATDLNINALRIAQNGIYPVKRQSINRKNYNHFGGERMLEDYYKVKDNMVLFKKELIRNINFKFHDLTMDPSPGSFDLIVCRNVLIYFNQILQEKVVDLFNRSLKRNSFLAIGSKESISWNKSAQNYKDVDIEFKIFQKTY